jgi:hypothetical protein
MNSIYSPSHWQITGTHWRRMRGMFTQLAAATAANGTHRPIKGGMDCNETIVRFIVRSARKTGHYFCTTEQCHRL